MKSITTVGRHYMSNYFYTVVFDRKNCYMMLSDRLAIVKDCYKFLYMDGDSFTPMVRDTSV